VILGLSKRLSKLVESILKADILEKGLNSIKVGGKYLINAQKDLLFLIFSI
jgi:hypothetical protein